ncbi:Putative peptidoglycan binding domain-containing protein [Rhizobium sp. NFR07]|uniref:peptidoglycan-binding domain-containing protein n=1 Tax=Rhizobium sp. NFR07 TaxID=1566262 RepID=UPI0008EFDA22|nr:peptidoglycan-binding domain-containing protein [Rhizobium sp. NFR07]SFB03362.1 Putative peptidoglycan binding domain-containing protein [Rhizobium sp. NFR07]
MTTRKRKAPDRRRTKKEKNLLSRLLAGTAALVARHPRPAAGGAIFIVVFSFVAANALWYQPGHHPSPFLATRDPSHPNAIAGYRTRETPDPSDVTTFRIERAPVGGQTQTTIQRTGDAPAEQAANRQPAPGAAPQPSGDTIESIIGGQPAPDRELVAGIQRELSRRGLYDGADDGLMGPRTEAAILFFEESTGLPQRGYATPELLATLQMQGRPSSAQSSSAMPDAAASTARDATSVLPTPIPRQAPRGEIRPVNVASLPNDRPAVQPAVQTARSQPARPVEKVAVRSEDPITAAIRSAERQPNMTPPADIPRAQQTRAQARPQPQQQRSSDPLPATQMVLQIQKGLSNIAYTDVEVDGVAGTQTKAAIKRFQRHYRLPETGEPDELVLKKLKAIGAL